MTLSELKTAIQTTVVAASGLPSASVIYGYPANGSYVATSFIRIHLSNVRHSGAISNTTNTPGTPVAGQELTMTTVVPVNQEVTLDLFTVNPEEATYLLSETVTKLQSRLSIDALDSSGYGLAITNNPRIQSLGSLNEPKYRDRATTTLNISYLSVVSDLLTYIEAMEGEGTITLEDGSTITVPLASP